MPSWPSCGQQNPDGFRPCGMCGAPLAAVAPSREQRKTVTVLFCDVTGSTALGESTDPEALRALLARYFERMKGIVESHGGTVEKFIGDAVMAVFGVPHVHEDDALRAARAAVEAVQPLTEAFRELGATVAAGRRLLDLVDREPRISDPAEPLPPPRAPFAIRLEDVRARYGPQERPALDGFSLRLDPGRRVVLLGRSGAGKSTVVHLLLRFIDPERGRVTLAGEDLRRYRQEDVRAVIAVAGPDARL